MTFVVLEGERKVKRIDTLCCIDTDVEIATTNSIDERLVFVFWIDDDDVSSEHETTKYFELHCK